MNFNKDPNQQEEYSVLQGNLAKFFNNSIPSEAYLAFDFSFYIY